MSGRYPFLIQDVLWMHTAQHRDLQFYEDMIRKTKVSIQAPTSSVGKLLKEQKAAVDQIERGWYYLFRIILKEHDEAEDRVLFPGLKASDPSSEDQFKKLTDQHKELEQRRDVIAKLVEELRKAEANPSKCVDVLSRLEAAVHDFAAFYKRHTADEEKTARAIVTQHMPEDKQMMLVNRLNGFYTMTQEGRIHIMLVREAVLKDPTKNNWYSATLPALVRYMMAPAISYLDPGCREYWRIFHPAQQQSY